MTSFSTLFVSLFLLCTLFCCQQSLAADSIGAGTTADPAYYYSESNYLGNGAFRTYVAIDHELEVPVAIGGEFSKSFLIDPPPAPGHYNVPVEFPAIASVYTPFQSYECNYTPEGHVGSPWSKPHFDWHFYFQNQPARNTEIISGVCGEGVSAETFCRGVKPIPAPCCPPLYVMPSTVVPAMGNHMASLDDTAFAGDFQNSLLIGAFDGRPTFYEPMIVTDHVIGVANGTIPKDCQPVPTPPKMAVAGYYPTQYCLFATVNNIRLEFDQFVFVPGGCGTVEEFGHATCAYDATKDGGITMNQVKNCNNCPHYHYTKEMANDK